MLRAGFRWDNKRPDNAGNNDGTGRGMEEKRDVDESLGRKENREASGYNWREKGR